MAALLNATEGGTPGTFRFSRTGDISRLLTVSYTVATVGPGMATPGDDYQTLSGSVTLGAGSQYADVPVIASNDTIAEPDEEVRVNLAAGIGYVAGAAAVANLFITDPSSSTNVNGTGTGLFGRYYNTQDLTEVKTARVDPTVNFNWDAAAPPGTAVGADHFSARWTGKVQPRYSGEYTFFVTADDGVRLWVNGVALTADGWGPYPYTPPGFSGKITLAAGQKYDIRLEYQDITGAAAVKLEWSHASQAKEVIPSTQLYPNTSTVGDRVWLDSDGNGRQDAGEPGVASVTVRILDDTGADAVPAKITAGGAYTFDIPAEKPYRLQFVTDSTMYRFTQPIAWEAEVDSNADAAGYTAMFTALVAGGIDLDKDAGLRPIVFDLDVNNNGTLTDLVDGAANYLPGYEGGTQKLSTGSAYNTDVYQGQQMKLIVDGIGSQTAGVTKIEFVIASVTRLPGYASNRTDTRVEGEGFDKDYAFSSINDGVMNDQQKQSLTVFPDRMEPTRTVVSFYAKDYGGAAVVEARVYVNDGTGERLGRTITLKVPKDEDSDGLADKWEEQMAARWAAQYGTAPLDAPHARDLIQPADDGELKDPDGAGALVAQKETGDGHTVLEEYRGYVLDGGGFNGQGANGHTGGHIRLDPARKEVLLEVDRAEVLNKVPGNNLTGVLDGATKVFSNADRGAGIYVYYLFDEIQLTISRDDMDTSIKQRAKLVNTRNIRLMSDFVHLLVYDQGRRSADQANGRPPSAGALAFDRVTTTMVSQRGVAFATTDVDDQLTSAVLPKRDEAFATAVAHEITHLLIDSRNTAGFDTHEHTTDPDNTDLPGGAKDRIDLMFKSSSRDNREFATVKFSELVQNELTTKTSEGFNV